MMKSFLKWMLGTVALTVLFVLAIPAQKAQAQNDYVSYQTFYDDLAPYGQWVYDPDYGNVWVPEVGNDFRPYYSRGYWAATEYGNTWVSDYPWGWAAFHYGRWTYNPFYGWVWIPGNTWGPAWVNWRTGGGYYGWAPLGPGVSISMSFGNYSCPNDWWVFVGPQYLYQPNFHNHWRGPRYNTTIINQTTIINNTYNNTYVYGPRPRDIERVTNQRVNVHRIANGDRGRTVVNNNTVNIYRPQVRGNTANESPKNVVRAPRSIGKGESVRTGGRPEFKSMVQRGEVSPVNGVKANTSGRQDRFDSRNDQGGRTNQARPAPDRTDRGRIDRQQPQQRIERPQQQQRVERPQPQQRMERPQMQQQRMERPQQQQRMERPQQQQRMERPQMQQQRMERPQPQQRMERPQMQQQRMERPQMQQQRMERSQPQPQRVERQSAPAPRPQPQGRPDMGNRGGGRR